MIVGKKQVYGTIFRHFVLLNKLNCFKNLQIVLQGDYIKTYKTRNLNLASTHKQLTHSHNVLILCNIC